MTMAAVFKEDELTPVLFDDAVKIVRPGLTSLIGKEPEQNVVALVLAKITLESGRKGMLLFTSGHCGNFGNIKAGPDYEGMYTLYPCNEVLNGQVEWFSPAGRLDKKGGTVVAEKYDVPPVGEGHPQCRFRAYANEVDGIYEYLDFIWLDKYRDARDALLTGNPTAYVHALKLKGYFTADETEYAKGVVGLFTEFVARLSSRPAPMMPAPDVTHLIASQPYNVTTVTALLNAAFAARDQQIVADNLADAIDPDEPDTVVTKGKA
jgi:hypothetical protein